MKRIAQTEGRRRPTGYHTSVAVFEYKGQYYVSTEAGTRKATKKEIENYNRRA